MTFRQYISKSPALFSLIGANLFIALILWMGTGVKSLSGAESAPLYLYLTIPSAWSDFLHMPWTLFTYMFTQVSFLHFLFNILWLLWFGRVFLFVSTERRLVATYIGGGIIGGVAFLLACNLFSHPMASHLIGSSAAVLAVMTASAVLAPNFEFRLFLIGGMRLKYVALLCILLTFFGIGGGNAGGQAAHIGGVIFGLAAAFFMKSKTNSLSLYFNNLRDSARKAITQKKHDIKYKKNVSDLNAEGVSKAISGRFCDEERLDQLLDKVRISGYDSLSSAEKRELNAISKRL